MDMNVSLMDFTAAYLNADTLHEYYHNHPTKGELWINGVRMVCKGLKSWYGGPDSGRGWHIKQDKTCLKFEFEDGGCFTVVN